MENFNIFIRSIFVDNMIFAYFLGMCSFLAVSKNVKTALGLGAAVTFMLVISLPINYLLENYVLRAGALKWLGPEFAEVDLSFLSLIMFIAVIASLTQLVEMAVEKFSPALYSSLGIFLPLIAVNCAILGGSLFMQLRRCRLGYRLVAGHCGHRRHPRTPAGVQQHSEAFARSGYYVYYHRPYGNSFYELPWHKTIMQP